MCCRNCRCRIGRLRARISSASRYMAHRKCAASSFLVLKGLIGSCSDYRATAPLRERTKPERIDNIHVRARLIENRGSDARITFSEGVTNRFRWLLLRGRRHYHRGEAKFAEIYTLPTNHDVFCVHSHVNMHIYN